ncbi:hypothetical protein [Nocardioides sp. GXZ039]|uniref:hypothetical protein n=1 Tax=Nocardioides sp. GXZ039 TaxID=3136018 RepID=UPI0030F49168
MTDDLRENERAALRSYAAPAEAPVGGTRRVLDALHRRRRRRTAFAAAGVTAALVIGVGVGAGLVRGQRDGADPAERHEVGAPGPWTELPQAPLEPRHESVGVWTGSELLVAGGTTARPCPPGADCAATAPSSYLRDGAAYDPATARWRAIAEAPAPLARAGAVWSGTEMIVTAWAGVFAYDPVADSWRTLGSQRLSTEPYEPAPAVTPEGIVFASYEQRAKGDSPDRVLDPASGTWTRLPHDPFGESYDRSVAWDGERLWLLSMGVEHHFDAVDGAPSRLAVLEGGLMDGTWRIVEEETVDVEQGQQLVWSERRLVLSPRHRLGALTYDPKVGIWSHFDVPEVSQASCALPAVGVSDRWIAGGGRVLVDADGESAVVDDCPGLADPDVAVWAGDDLLVWGGPNADWSAGTALGYTTGAVDPVCPETLARSDENQGLGTGDPAAEAPSLPEPDEAWVCRYTVADRSESNDGESSLEWHLDAGPHPVPGGAVPGLAADVRDLRPSNPDGCDDDLGPTYLLAYRSGDRTVGVLADDFGCDWVRLTDDPATVPAGESDADGLVPGVLTAPPGLLDRLRAVLR